MVQGKGRGGGADSIILEYKIYKGLCIVNRAVYIYIICID